MGYLVPISYEILEAVKPMSETKDKTSTGLEQNLEALLCYVLGWVTGIIFLLLEKDNKFIRFHAVQSIIVFGAYTVIAIILGFIPIVGWIINLLLGIAAFILWIVLMVKAYNGQMYKLPVAGDIADRNSKPMADNVATNDSKPMTDSKSATDNKTDDKGKTTGNPNTHATILLVIGIILFILGILIVSIHGAPLRGSGVGTIAIIAGIVLLIIAYFRFRSKRSK